MSEYTLGLSLLSLLVRRRGIQRGGNGEPRLRTFGRLSNWVSNKVAIIAHIGRYQDTFIIL